jgi:hypothetical protein
MKVQDLPQPFQDRIARFNRLFQAGTEDHHDFEHHFDDDGKPGLFQYEMFCIETALAFAELLPTKEVCNSFIEKCANEYKPKKYDWESDDDYEKRIESGPTISDIITKLCEEYPENKIREEEHSGNTMGASWMLFRMYLIYPELVPYVHGTLAPLIGDEGYYDDRSDLPNMEGVNF